MRDELSDEQLQKILSDTRSVASGVSVVMDRCLLVEHARLPGRR